MVCLRKKRFFLLKCLAQKGEGSKKRRKIFRGNSVREKKNGQGNGRKFLEKEINSTKRSKKIFGDGKNPRKHIFHFISKC